MQFPGGRCNVGFARFDVAAGCAPVPCHRAMSALNEQYVVAAKQQNAGGGYALWMLFSLTGGGWLFQGRRYPIRFHVLWQRVREPIHFYGYNFPAEPLRTSTKHALANLRTAVLWCAVPKRRCCSLMM